MAIPVYLKTAEDMSRPADPEFYLLAQNGLFFCRNHAFFQSDVPAKRKPRALAEHEASCLVRFPLVPAATLEYIVAFFSCIFYQFQSEAVVLLYWDATRKRYRVVVPKQRATVWQSYSGHRSPMDVAYEIPLDIPRNLTLVGDIHSHGDMGCTPSWTDKEDEVYRDGVHVIIGRIENEPPECYLAVALDGHRFTLDFAHLFQGYRQRRRIVPQAWLDQIEVEVQRSHWKSWGFHSPTKATNDRESDHERY